MIIPSIDLMGGQTVQLIGGEHKVLEAGAPLPLAQQFALTGELAVIDLDAALRQGSNRALLEPLLPLAPCRVGGGIRDLETAISWLDAGAEKIILGSAAKKELLQELPRERVIAALDCRHGEVVIDGWRTPTGAPVAEKIQELQPYVSGFLVTFVEREGRLAGIDKEAISNLAALLAPHVRLTVAGGITTPAEIRFLDDLGVDAQVGMALYKGLFTPIDAVIALLRSDRPDGLWPTIVSDERGNTLGLAYSSSESLQAAYQERRGIYHSRSRGGLWRKGASSGATQELLQIALDCDRDTLQFTVKQQGPGFCHQGTASCFGKLHGLSALQKILKTRIEAAPPGSYTARLFHDPKLLASKLLEEAHELVEAETPAEITREAADLSYFTLVYLLKNGVELAEVEKILDQRALKVTRRPGNAKK